MAAAAGAWVGGTHPSWTSPCLLGAACVGVGAFAFQRRSGAHLLVLLGWALAGAGLAASEARSMVPAGLGDGGTFLLEGEVERVTVDDDRRGLELAVTRVSATSVEPPPPVRFRVALATRGALKPLEVGQRIRVQARLYPVEAPGNPGQFDTSASGRRRSRTWAGSFDARRLTALSPPSAYRRWLTRTHRRLEVEVRRRAPSPESAGLYLALAAGMRTALSDEAEEAFARSGLAHVLSVSGLHVAALALGLLAVARRGLAWGWRGALTRDARRLAAPMGLPLLWGYVAFTGWQPPAIRSALMATVMLLAMAAWRSADALNGLALALTALVAVDPAGAGDLSLQLSFASVLGLILLAPALREAVDPTARGAPSRWGPRARAVRNAVYESLCASAAVTLAGLPLIAAAFGRVSLAGLVANVVCLPVCAALTYLAAGGAALFALAAPLAGPVLWAGAWASEGLLRLAHTFSALPAASLEVAGLGTGGAALFTAGLLLFALGSGRWRWGLALTPVGLLGTAVAALPQPGLTVTFLAVGQGDAAVLSSRGAHALVDGGGTPGGSDPGLRVIVPFLRERHIRRLNLAVLSHPHPDHALGLASALNRVPAERLWVAAGTTEGPLTRQVAQASGLQPEEVQAGQPALSLGEATIRVLGPPTDPVLLESVNDRSVVLRVEHGEISFLLAGDVEEEGERAFDPGLTTVIKAPHHGSRTSSSRAWVARAHPRYVVFCVGRKNRFGFPHPEVAERYRQAGAQCFRTDWDGAVEFHSDGRTVRHRTFRKPPLP
ncbi:MAG TPA: DNA internalization-related competence protein ComEC/Rec2 [Myxococcaceae bacterium]|nr:DNA internalization-related competence protein ComEC/Rec2 [Myxococcaceae bacterium]